MPHLFVCSLDLVVPYQFIVLYFHSISYRHCGRLTSKVYEVISRLSTQWKCISQNYINQNTYTSNIYLHLRPLHVLDSFQFVELLECLLVYLPAYMVVILLAYLIDYSTFYMSAELTIRLLNYLSDLQHIIMNHTCVFVITNTFLNKSIIFVMSVDIL